MAQVDIENPGHHQGERPAGNAPVPEPAVAATPERPERSERSEFSDIPRVWSPPLAAVAARWAWLLGGALLVALLALLAPTSHQSTATAVMQMTNGDLDSLRTKQLGQTAERTLTSEAVITAAAAARGIDARALMERVTAKWENDTDVVSVTVTGDDPRATVEDVNAVAQAVATVGEQQTRGQLSQIQKESNDLLVSGSLRDAVAENARRSQLGTSVAGRQDAATATSTSLVLLDRAVEAQQAGLSRSVRLILGLTAGGLLAGAAAVLVPMSRRRVRTVREVSALSTDLKVRPSSAAVGHMAGRLVESETKDLTVVALPEAGVDATTFAHDVASAVRDHGLSASVVNGLEREVGERLMRREGRARVRLEHGTDVLIVVVPDEDWALRLLRGQAGFRSAVVGVRGQSRFGDVWRSTSALQLARPTVVLTR